MQILINDQLVDISHLRKIERRMTLDLRGGKQKKNALLAFRFSCHCYSRGPKEGEEIPPKTLVQDGSPTNPRDRIFCPTRYELSLQLIQRIDHLILTNGEVQRSRHLNFFATRLFIPDTNGIATEIPYYIFMKPTKKQDPNQQPRLDIFVESAYPGDDPQIPAPSTKGAARPLSEVLGGVWTTGTL